MSRSCNAHTFVDRPILVASGTSHWLELQPLCQARLVTPTRRWAHPARCACCGRSRKEKENGTTLWLGCRETRWDTRGERRAGSLDGKATSLHTNLDTGRIEARRVLRSLGSEGRTLMQDEGYTHSQWQELRVLMPQAAGHEHYFRKKLRISKKERSQRG